MINEVSIEKIKIGDYAEISKTITEEDISDFADISLDYNPIHLDHEFALKTHFKKRIVHGMLTASLISAVIGTKLPGKNTIYLYQNLKFTAPAFIGDTLSARVEVKKIILEKNIVILSTKVINQEGKLIIDGEATVMKEKSDDSNPKSLSSPIL